MDIYSIELHGFGLGPYSPQLIYLAQDMSKYQLSSINKYHKLQCLNYPFSQSCPSHIVFSSTGRYNSCSTSLHMCSESVQLCILFPVIPIRPASDFLPISRSAFINRSFYPFGLQLHVHVKWLYFNRRIVFNRSHQWNS